MVVNRIFKLLFLCVFSFSVAACTKPSAEGISMNIEKLYGAYKITGIQKYGGSLTSDKEANKQIGSKIIIRKKQFISQEFNIKQPVYTLNKIDFEREGNILSKEYSVFYGFDNAQKYLTTLSVFDPTDTSDWVERYEIIGQGKLLYMLDGRLYFLTLEKNAN